ncbi:tRNA pseudouridine synthase 4 [Escovopsis weberi]|uniref:tRNA pseudouridine(55) synthase n=1 Tax=Escovopsis weberi TaxID=150374 RepID=A0A0N0RTE6_ESCWE|nr:tRNA pseudouridine synthase 4 [Escovopsis weberi]
MAKDIVREGVFAINKPCGLSSAQVLRECQQHFNPSLFFKPMIDAEVAKRLKESGGQFRRRRFEKRASQVKIGHGGTLDPLATGVLIMGIGSATKVLNQFLECTKTYETTVVFGAATDTYDRVGRVLTKRPYDHITRDRVERELASFRGKQTQIPPLYSALKMDGKPLYEYAREGRPIPREIKGRDVDILEIELVEWYEPKSHNHHWPTEEAEAAECNLAEQVWRLKKQQENANARTLTPEEREQDDQAVAAHETFKRQFEERQDELIRDHPNKRHKQKHLKHLAMMSGALGQLPQPTHSSKGKNLVPTSPDDSTPPPWSDEGPPACKIRLKVTSGFYVRSFCHDLGAKLGSAGLMAELCRVRQSDFTVGGTNCLEYDDLAKGEEVWGPKVADMLARWNGEPHGQWPGIPEPKKRLRSPPPPLREDSPPRKFLAQTNGSKSMPTTTTTSSHGTDLMTRLPTDPIRQGEQEEEEEEEEEEEKNKMMTKTRK